MSKTRTKSFGKSKRKVFSMCGKFPDCPGNDVMIFNVVCLACSNNPDSKLQNSIKISKATNQEEYNIWIKKRDDEYKDEEKKLKEEGWGKFS